jgi:hypothetical protein
MRARISRGWLAAALVLMFALAAGMREANAQAAAPVVNVAAPAGLTPAPDAGCNTVEKPLSAGGASIVPEVVGQQKNWQPPGGEISFTVRSFVQIPADALVIVCFRWKRISDRQDNFIMVRPTHLDLLDGGRLLRVTVVVPENLPKAPPRFSGDGEYAGFFLVPLAEVRILVLGKDSSVAADVSHTIGIANRLVALLSAALTIVLAFAVLSWISQRRLKSLGLGGLDPFIQVITTPDGYASLSHFQMVVWTFVVAASAVYVMVLSGDLIEVTTGTLVLLGISGAVTVGTRLHDNRQAVTNQTVPPARKPMWSDLIVHEINGQREIDVSRVQMLYFTLITAAFVVMRVLTTYVIPEIPQGFQILMGISNAVYFGSKVAQPPASTAANTAAANDDAPPPMPPAQS